MTHKDSRSRGRRRRHGREIKVCYHEAGHAVAAALLAGIRPRWARVADVRGTKGGALHDDNSTDGSATHLGYALVALAGPAAQHMMTGESVEEGAGGDLSDAAHHLTWHCGRRPTEAEWSACIYAAGQLVSEFRPAVEKLGRRLRVVGRVSASEITAAVTEQAHPLPEELAILVKPSLLD